MLATIIEAVEAAQITDYSVRCGDLGLFAALLDGIDMPERWRQRLRAQFWRPVAFREELKRLVPPE